MIIRNKKRIIVLLIMFVLIATCSIHINASAKTKLTKTQQKRADYIASICEKNWYKYKVYPSVCLGQAVAESGLTTINVSDNLNKLFTSRDD